MAFPFEKPGLAFSGLAHGAVLVFILFNLSLCSLSVPPADEAADAIPVEVDLNSDTSQIAKGQQSSREAAKEPASKADKVAAVEEQHDLPPDPEVKQDTPPPPPPKPADPTPPVPIPPVPPPPPPPPPVPEPPQRPVPPPPTPTPPLPAPKPAPVKPAPPAPVPPARDPDADTPAPPPPPKPVPKPPEPPKRAEVKPPPVPPKPVPVPPQPPKVVEKPAPKRPDQIAKEIAEEQPDPKPARKPAPRVKPAPAPRETAAAEGTAEPSDQKAFDPTDISRLLRQQPAGAPPSTGKAVSKAAPPGAAGGRAPKMTLTQSDALDGLLADQFKQCWSYLGLDHGRYIPEIKVAYAQDGSLLAEPQLLNRPSDPNARSLAESALRAVRQCNPLHIPAQFAPYYDQWRSRILRFDPAEMAG